MTRGTDKNFYASGKPDCWRLAFGLALLAGVPQLGGAASPAHAGSFVPSTLVVSRIQYVGDSNSARSGEPFPSIFTDPTVTGIQGVIFLDMFRLVPGSLRLGSLALTDQTKGAATTSFSSKSEGSLHLSEDGHFLTYMGYFAPPTTEGVSNSETTGATLTNNTAPTFDRVVALIAATGAVSITRETNAFSGDNPRGAITVDGNQFYMAGNADSSLNKDGTGPGTTIGIRLGKPFSTTSIQLGTYFASDRTDESTK